MSELPLISIITINYNQERITCELLESLQYLNYKNIEVFVIDNASNVNPEPLIAQKFPNVRVIVSPVNLGFAGGNNLGIKEAKGKYILLLNNDTEVDPDFLDPMVSLMEKDSSIGMASPKIVFHNTNIIQYAGSKSINPYTGRGSKIGNKEVDHGQHDTTRETDLAHGAALIISAEVIKKVGLMPEIFFLYYEEHDWCEAVKRAGYKIYFVSDSTVYHKESLSVGKNNPLKTYYLNRNRLLYMRRNVWGIKLVFGILFFILISVPKNTFKFLIKREVQHLKAFYKGIFWNLYHPSVK